MQETIDSKEMQSKYYMGTIQEISIPHLLQWKKFSRPPTLIQNDPIPSEFCAKSFTTVLILVTNRGSKKFNSLEKHLGIHYLYVHLNIATSISHDNN